MADEIISILKSIWTEGVQGDYAKGLIVSESSLMAAFYHHARIALQVYSGGFTVYTEPTLWWNEVDGSSDEKDLSRLCKPDLLIGQGLPGERGRAVAVIEFKYKPWHRPDYRGDVKKLLRIAKSTTAYGAMINFESGTEHTSVERHLRVDDETRLIYAAIGKRNCPACRTFSDEVIPFGRSRFLHFTGSVEKGDKPNFDTISYE